MDIKKEVVEDAEQLYRNFRLELYKHVFGIVGEKEDSLTATEYFSAEVIFLLRNPTVTEFADCMNILSAHSAYKIKTLIEKGYVKKTQTEDKRTFRLNVTDKFFKYYDKDFQFGSYVFNLFKDKLSEENIYEIDNALKAKLNKIDVEENTNDKNSN